MPAPSPEELQDAVLELHQYLSDQKPPLMVADSVEMLLGYPADFLAAQIHGWIASQSLSAPVADYLFHGAKKLSVLGELDLLPRDALAERLRGLSSALLPYCPEADRDLLKQNLDRLGQAAAQAAPSATMLQTPGPKPVEKTSGLGDLVARGMRRLSLLLDHLRPLANPSAPAERRTELASQFVTTAAVQAKTTQELDQNLAPLRQVGVDTGTDHLLRTLASSLAGWALPPMEGRAAPVVSGEQIEAIRRIVSLPDDATEVARRFREMVHAGIEQFNEGNLGRAVPIFDLAEQLAGEQKVKPMFVDALRTQGHEYLDAAKLQAAAARLDTRPQLRRILDFFTALKPPALLGALDGEPARDKRHQLLALLEVHDQAARATAWETLKTTVQPGATADPFFQMNLVYLLRILPRPESASVEEEVDAVMRTAGRASPPPLVKQVIAYLASTRHEKAERALITYLRVFESMLLQPETAAYTPADVETLLDRTCAALARYGTPRAWRVLIDHGLKVEARLGSPFLRLAEAGRVDLSSARDLVARIVAAVRAELPKGGVMAMVTRKSDEKAISLVQSLAGTPLPEVQELLNEVAAKYPDRELGKAAAKALASLASVGKPAPPPATLSGDLEQFGLPNLLQTLGQSQLTGVLSVLNAEGRTQATLVFERGQFRGGQNGAVRAESAVYELLERPFKGTFAFVSRTDLTGTTELIAPQDLFGILMEGIRRYDELRRAAGVVPDGSSLVATGREHGAPPDEEAAFVASAWQALSSGRAVGECEAALRTDAYRVRRLAAQWVEEGALELRAS